MEKSSKPISEVKEVSLKRAFDKKTLLLLSFAVIALLFYLILENINIFNIMELIVSTNFLILIIGASATFIAVLFDTIAWKILLGISSIRPSIPATYRIQLTSFSYGLLIPSAGAVEIIMRIALGRKEFINEKENRYATSGEILSSVFAHRLCGLIAFIPISILVAFAILAYFDDIVYNETNQHIPDDIAITFSLAISILAVIIIIIFFLIVKAPNIAKSFTSLILSGIAYIPLIGKFAENALEPSGKIIDDFSIQLAYLAQNKFLSIIALLLAFFSQVAHWVSIYFILHSIQIPILLDQVAAVNFLSGTVDLIPVGIPGMAGLKEITLSVFLKSGLGLDSTLAFSGAILVQLVKFYFLIIVGILVYIVGKTRVSTYDLEENSNSILEEQS
ncbi:MAG: lysylphosphatidylglycerol synthase transmembrane domain-containing protein [Candidatus Hodarchaeota archaeon]